MTSLIIDNMEGFPGTNQNHEETILDSLNEKFETLNECLQAFGKNMNNVAEINTNFNSLNKDVKLFIGSVRVLRTCHIFSDDDDDEENRIDEKETMSSTMRSTNTKTKRRNNNNSKNIKKKPTTNNYDNNKKKSSSSSVNNGKNNNPYSVRKIIHLIPQIYRSRDQIEKLDLILRFLHMKEQPCGLTQIHRSLGVSLIMCRKYLNVLLKNKKILRKKDRQCGLVYYINKANFGGGRR